MPMLKMFAHWRRIQALVINIILCGTLIMLVNNVKTSIMDLVAAMQIVLPLNKNVNEDA